MAKKDVKNSTEAKLERFNKWVNINEYETSKKGKSATQKDFDDVELVRGHYEDAKREIDSGCYWPSSLGDESDTVSGSSWRTHREKNLKMWMQWAVEPSSDDYRSNIKSPMTLGRIESTSQKQRKLTIQFSAKATFDEDRQKAKIFEIIINHIMATTEGRKEIALASKESLIFGNGYFQLKYKEVWVKHTYREKNPKRSKDVTEGTETEIKVTYQKPALECTYSDITIEYIPTEEIYYDPSAKQMQGVNKSARYVMRRRIVNIDEIRSTYAIDPEAKNLDKIKASGGYSATDQRILWSAPTDILLDDDAELIEYENKMLDKHIVLVNDIPIISKPLPNNHKQLTYHELPCIVFPNQKYGMGLPDLLQHQQIAEEILINMVMDKIYESMNNTTFIDKSVWGETTAALIRANSKYIPIDTSQSPSIGNKIMPMPYNPVGFDAFKALDLISKNATIASQIDPTQTSIVPSNAPATFAVMSKETAENMIANIVDNWAMYGLYSAGAQLPQMIKQFYSEPYVKGMQPRDAKKIEDNLRTIRIEGKKVEIDSGLEEVRISDDKENYSFLQTKPEYLDTKGEIEVQVTPDSLEIISRGLEMQKISNMMTQVIPLAANPDNPQSVAMNPNAVFNLKEVATLYVDTFNVPSKILLNQDDSDAVEIADAVLETNRMLEGKIVDGRPGRSEVHLQYHDQVAESLENTNLMYEQTISEMAQEAPETVGPDGMPIMSNFEPPADIVKAMERNSLTISNLRTHLERDMTLPVVASRMPAAPAPSAPEPVEQSALGMEDPMAAMGGAPMMDPAMQGGFPNPGLGPV